MRAPPILQWAAVVCVALHLLQPTAALTFSSNKCFSVPTDINLAPFYCNASLPPFFKVCASNTKTAAAKAKDLYSTIPPSFADCASRVTSACAIASTKPLFTPLASASSPASAPSTSAAPPPSTTSPPSNSSNTSSNSSNTSTTSPPPPPPRVATAADFVGPSGLSPCLCCSFLPVASLMQCDDDSHCSGDRTVLPCAVDCVSTWTAMCTLIRTPDASANASSSSDVKLDEYDLITHCMRDKVPFATNSENDYVCLRTSQLVLEHPTCGAQWAVHSSKPLKFTVVVMIIVLLGSFGVGLMLDFIHIKRW